MGRKTKCEAISTAWKRFCGSRGRRRTIGEPPHAGDRACSGGMTINAAARRGMERQALGAPSALPRGSDGLFAAAPGRPRSSMRRREELSELLIEGPDPDKDGVSAYTLDTLSNS